MAHERNGHERGQKKRDAWRRNPSSWDIAREANVSQSTVSRVINNNPRISEATRQRVKKAMETLGYSPNAAARTLITGRSNLIGLVVSNITNPFYPEVIEAVVSTAAEYDYNVILCNTQESRELQTAYLELLIEHQVDGAILTSSLLDSQQLLDDVGFGRIPLVMVNRSVHGAPVDTVRLDNDAAGRMVAKHLLQLGHRNLAFVGGLAETSTDSMRLKGFRTTLADAGTDLPDDHVVHGAFTEASGYALTRDLLALPDRPTALFCADDLIALGAMNAVLDAGLRIPDDVAVVGVDDVPAASLRQVGLTTVRQPASDMGSRAVKLLLERVKGGPDGEPIEIVLRPKLIVRRTCGAETARAKAPSGKRVRVGR
ncbi:MAG TPA: LacI family DNA-binding transcriptional regulator [Jatrophihabitantaceae bacterium]